MSDSTRISPFSGKPLLVTVGSKLTPERVVQLNKEAVARGMSTSELVRWVVDEHYNRDRVYDAVKDALGEFFPERAPKSVAVTEEDDS